MGINSAPNPSPIIATFTLSLIKIPFHTQIERARDEADHLRQDAEEEAQRSSRVEDEFDPNRRQRKYEVQKPERVLVRLKVEHAGFSTLNNQRFGAQFVEEVVRDIAQDNSIHTFPFNAPLAHWYPCPFQANPSDILLFHKKRQAESAKKGASKKRSSALDIPTEPEDLEKINVDDLVAENLANSDKKLKLLDEKSMNEGLSR